MRIVVAAAITDGDGLKRITVVVYCQGHCVRYAWVGEAQPTDVVELAFVMEIDRFARMSEKDRMPVGS
jgi:hypothetical protein